MKKIVGLFGAIVALCSLFALAGTAAWWNAWLCLAFLAVLGTFTTRLINGIPGLAEERRTAGALAMAWDRQLVRMIDLALPAMLIVAALDMRFRFLPAVPALVSAGALAAMIPAATLAYRAIAANAFFSSHVRIQSDRGHLVVSAGPYGIVRHPGYAGAAAFNLLLPVALGSWAALAIGCVVVALLLYRTGREDRMLLADLPGYAAYARQVQSRLVPGLW